MWQIACSERIAQIPSGCKGTDCSDSDYDAEDAVRDTLLNSIPDHGLQFGQPKNNELIRWETDVFWEKWFKQWEDSNNLPPEKVPNKPEADVFPICTSNGNVKSLVLCNSDREKKHACICAKDSSLRQCDNLDKSDLAIAICKEKSSDKVISCGKYTKTFLCYPKNSHYTEPIRPCREKHRFICLSETGSLERCQKNASLESRQLAVMDIPDNPEWEDWWKEWAWNAPGVGLRNPDEVLARYLCKPRPHNEILVDCQFDGSKTRACVGITSRYVSECMNFNGSIEVHIPVCIERSTNKVFTCGDFPASFLCFPGGNDNSSILPCRDENRQLCLSYDSLLEKCIELENGTGKKILDMDTAVVLSVHEEDTIHVEKFLNGNEPLCIQKRDKKLVRCNEDSLTSFACMNTISGNIQLCQRVQNDIKTEIRICVKNQDSTIMTCAQNAELCFPPARQTTPFSPCKFSPRMICLSKEGSLMACTNPNVGERQDISVLENSTHHERENQIRICQKDNAFIDCLYDNNVRLVCFEERKGTIKLCTDERPGDLNNPLCYMVDTGALIECWTKNKYVCLARHGVKKYIYCDEEHRYLCLKDGAIANCSSLKISRREQDPLSTIRDTDYKNIDAIYKAEKMSLQKIRKNVKALCYPDSKKLRFQPCLWDPSINFACLGIKQGVVNMCSKFPTNELIIPICQENSREVVACGKFFKANLCSPIKTKSFTISTCNNRERFLCRTKKGILKRCINTLKHPENKQNMDKSNEKISDAGATEYAKDNIGNENYRKSRKSIVGGITRKKKSDKDVEKTSDEQDYNKNAKNEKNTKENEDKLFEQYKKIKSSYRKEEVPEEEEKDSSQSIKHDGHDIHHEGEGESEEEMLEEYYNEEENFDLKLSEKGSAEDDDEKEHDKEKYKKAKSDDDDKEEKYDDKIEYEDDESKKENSDEDDKEETMTVDNNDEDDEGDTKSPSESKHVEEEEKDEYYTEHLVEIMKKEESLLESVHMMSQHLCMEGMRSNKMINCDKDQSYFACIGANKGNIKACKYFKETEVALAICTQAKTAVLVTCDIVSNTKLCFPGGKINSPLLTPCRDKMHQACLGENGRPVKCNTLKPKLTKSHRRFARHGEQAPTDEKFFRLHCHNCSIESKFILEGTSSDVEPEIEVFTFSQ